MGVFENIRYVLQLIRKPGYFRSEAGYGRSYTTKVKYMLMFPTKEKAARQWMRHSPRAMESGLQKLGAIE